MNILILIVALLAVVVIIFFIFSNSSSNNATTSEDNPFSFSTNSNSAEGQNIFVNDEIKTLDDGTKYIVNPDEIIGGGPAKDGIPSIDNPNFVTLEEANEWIRDDALVLALNYKGVKRVYPLQIMTWHELVNDNVAGDPILITYCPLCGSGIAYERTINGEEVEFGTSGKLYNSNLVMYDRKTDTYWTQIGGKAILGELTGMELTLVDLETVKWGKWKQVHPDSQVLSTQTGFSRDYTSDGAPYSNYFADDFYLFPGIQNKDSERKLANKEFVFGIEINDKYKAYAKKDVESKGTIEDTFNGVNLKIEQKIDGSVIFTNLDTGKELPKEVDFWFAWFAFHPDTELYGFE